ncbi:hypothetical protein COCVIDRAFT_31245 [Bipolaris victoriae FI3]|uniref:Uncharacterized protein n=1 Tax=Bipolaris victoriae (strain FI3) TaxID=930091 RepID=W7E3C9_BIPV3|nr:hypothetical protein COCVIDRAFT_31245 [Bipolaris victoriae FI3]
MSERVAPSAKRSVVMQDIFVRILITHSLKYSHDKKRTPTRSKSEHLHVMPALVVHMADNAAQLLEEVTIFTNGSEEVVEQIQAMCPETPSGVDRCPIYSLVNVKRGVKVAFTNGNTKEFRFLVHNPLTYSQGPFATQLGLALS